MNRYRRSARETFANCKYRYEQEYLKGVSTENDATRRGSVFHEARSLYIGRLFTEKATHDHEIAERAWAQAVTSQPPPVSEYEDTFRLWQAWTERYTLNLDTFYSAERGLFCKPFSCELRFDETHVPEPDTFRIIDAKTHWKLPTVEALRQSVQTGMYLAGARLLFPGFLHYQIVYDFVRVNQQITITLSDAEMDGWVRWVQESDEALDIAAVTNLYPPTGGAHCGYCQCKCPLADHPGIAPLRYVTEQDAKDAISRIAARRRMAELEVEALDAYVNEHGPVSAGGQSWAHRPEVSRQYPAEAVLMVLRATGVDYQPMLSATAVKPLLTTKKYSAARDGVSRVAVEKVYTRLSAKSVTEN